MTKGRLFIVYLLLALALITVVWRLVDLTWIQRTFLLQQSKQRVMRTIGLPAYRGSIVDRFHFPLAVSTPVQSIWINPQLFHASTTQWKQLSALLQRPVSSLKKRTQQSTHRHFVYLLRGITPQRAEKIKQLQIAGLFFQPEYKRYYPMGEVSAQVVGLTNIDDQGQEDLELAYNHWLSGQDGRAEVMRDRFGHWIGQLKIIQPAKQGKDLVLSIDHRIQYLAYTALRDQVKRYQAQSGSVVVLNVKTGEILAMVNQPSYNPNTRPLEVNGSYRNRAITDIFEPGSVMKAFTISYALRSGKYTPDTEIDTNPGWMDIDGYKVRDDLNYGIVTLTQLLQKSSNIAAAKILLSLNPRTYWELLKDFGFGERSTSGFPGEASGRLPTALLWNNSTIVTLAYGYGVAVTTLQLAHAYATLANHGVKTPISFLKIDKPTSQERVLPQKVADTVINMLKTVVQPGGTGTRARIAAVNVAGKTGTAYIAGPHGYEHHHYVSSFVGIAPADKPHWVVAVVLRDPKKGHFGGIVAAPVFARIMSGIMRL